MYVSKDFCALKIGGGGGSFFYLWANSLIYQQITNIISQKPLSRLIPNNEWNLQWAEGTSFNLTDYFTWAILPLRPYERKTFKTCFLALNPRWPWNLVYIVRYIKPTDYLHIMILSGLWPFLRPQGQICFLVPLYEKLLWETFDFSEIKILVYKLEYK